MQQHSNVGQSIDSILSESLAEYSVAQSAIGYIANPGNAGDGIIAASCYQLFSRLGLNHRLKIGRGATACNVQIYAGGGNLVKYYPQARSAIVTALESDMQKFILLPHTIRDCDNLLSSLDKRFVLICRERESYDYVTSKIIDAAVYLTHDLAFTSDFAQFKLDRSTYFDIISHLSPRSRHRQYRRWRNAIRSVKPDSRGTLTLLRSDIEAKSGNPAPREWDLSSLHGSHYSDPGETSAVAADFVAVLNEATQVVSDRLHVCIVAARLGKKVTMLDNSYGKNRAVFEYSMKGRFPNIDFQST